MEETKTMDEVVEDSVEEAVPFDERFAALEHQCYLMYLQLNAVTQLLVEHTVLDRKEIGALMDKMHGEITEAVDGLATGAIPGGGSIPSAE